MLENSSQNGSISNWFKEHDKQVLPFVFAICLFGIAISRIDIFRQLLLCDDEFGYFATSAFLRGLDWTKVTSGIPYYSYGYGMFILTPISMIFSSPSTLYQATIVVNGFMLVGSYCIARIMAKHLFSSVNWKTRDIVCFLIMLYPANMVYSHMAWTETMLTFLFWIYAWISYTALQKPSHMKFVGWALVTVLMYVVHQRTLGIFCATVIIIVTTFLLNRERRRYIVSFTTVIIVGIILHHMFKEYYQEALYAGSEILEKNDFSGQVKSVSKAFSTTGVIKLIQSFVGKWFYLMISTGFVIWWAIITLFQKSWLGIKCKYQSTQQIFKYRKIWESLILLCFIANFMICVLGNMNIDKYDNLVYGRYNENILGIYLLYGIFFFLKDKKWKKKLFVGCVLTVVAMFVCQYVLDCANTDFYQVYHSVCTALFLETGISPKGRIIWFGIVGLVVVLLMVILTKGPRWKKFTYAQPLLTIAIPMIIWLHISGTIVLGDMVEIQLYNSQDSATIAKMISGLNLDRKVYYANIPENRAWAEIIQFLLPEEVEVTYTINVTQEQAYYIVDHQFLNSDVMQEYFVSIYTGQQFSLVILKDGEIMQEINALAQSAGQ